MLELIKRAEQKYPRSNAIIVCDIDHLSDDLLMLISDHEINIVGTAHSARTALAMAAISPAEFALVHPEFSSRPDGRELVRRLQDDWGVDCLLAEKPGDR